MYVLCRVNPEMIQIWTNKIMVVVQRYPNNRELSVRRAAEAAEAEKSKRNPPPPKKIALTSIL